jgi:hypothetical protein
LGENSLRDAIGGSIELGVRQHAFPRLDSNPVGTLGYYLFESLRDRLFNLLLSELGESTGGMNALVPDRLLLGW